MRKILIVAMALNLMGLSVTKASPSEDFGSTLKYEAVKPNPAFELQSLHQITPGHDFYLVCIHPDVILVAEPLSEIVTLSYVYVEPTLSTSAVITSRCNSPPYT